MSEKKCVCGHELESGGYQVLELHGESLLKDHMDVELWVCPRCGRIAFFMREKDRKDRYRAECGGRTDEELSALLESPDAPALLRDAAREVLDSRAEWRAAEQRRRAKETEREQESTPRGGFFSGLFGGRDDDKPRKNQPPEFCKSQALNAHNFSLLVLSNFDKPTWPPSCPMVGSLRVFLFCSPCSAPLTSSPFDCPLCWFLPVTRSARSPAGTPGT